VKIPDQAIFEIGENINSRYSSRHDAHKKIRTSYSGTDITAYISVPPAPGTPYDESDTVQGVLGTLQTISYSIHRDVAPVRALGKSRPHAYTRGPRTIAGTMVWTTMDQHVLAGALEHNFGEGVDTSTVLSDQLPAFDVVITFANEWPGRYSKMVISGIRMVNEGSTLSIDDMITEQTNTYVATDIDLIHRDAPFRVSREGQFPRSADDLMRVETFKRIGGHRNPFI
jgi:hypothetical protein